MTPVSILTLLLCFVTVANAFQLHRNMCRLSTRLQNDEAGKGFGKKKEVVKESELKQPFNARLNPSAETAATDVTLPAGRSEEKNLYATPRARREAELDEKIARLKEEEDLISSDPSVGAVPELVADRMIGRIVAFFGVPVFGGMQTEIVMPKR